MTLTSKRKIWLLYWLMPGLFLCSSFPVSSQQADDALEPDIVIVRSRKDQHPVQNVPTSIVYLGKKALENSRGHSIEEIQHLIPGLSLDYPDGFGVLYMRGVGGGGRNIGIDPRVGIYVDGMYMSQPPALSQSLFEARDVEVLRGPQGHLFGRNSVAGQINITSLSPSRFVEGNLYGAVGNKGIYESHASISGPLSDNLLGRFAVSSESRNGFTVNEWNGQQLDDLSRLMARSQIVFQAAPQLKVSFFADTAEIRQHTINGEPVSDLFGFPLMTGTLPKRHVNFNTIPHQTVTMHGYHFVTNHITDNGYQLDVIAGQRFTSQKMRQDNDYTPYDLLRTHFSDTYNYSTQEIRLTSPRHDRFQYVMGAYRLDELDTSMRTATIGQDAASTLVQHPLFGIAPFSVIAGAPPGATSTSDGNVATVSHAFFASVLYTMNETLTLNVGGRYTRERKRLLFDLDGTASGNFGIGTLVNYQDSKLETNISPVIGITYAPVESQSYSIKYSKSFKSGGWNVDFLDAAAASHPSYDTEYVDSYELGTKGKLSGTRLYYDLAAYLSRYSNYQVFQFVDLGGGATSIQLRNAAKARTQGLEGSISWKTGSSLDLGVRMSVNKAVFTQFEGCAPGISCSGNELPFAPKYAVAVMASYVMPLPEYAGKLKLYGDYSRQGRTYADPLNDPDTQRIPARNLTNLRFSYLPNSGKWSCSLWIRNLFNKDTVTLRSRDFLGNHYVRRMDPRTIGVEAELAF